MSQQNQINLKEKSTVELKAIAYDIQNVVSQYQQMLQIVTSELTQRVETEKAAQEVAASEDEIKQAPVKQIKKAKS